MEAHHLLCVEVLPAYSEAWLPYYTHYRNMDVNHYVCIDVLPGDSVG